MRKPIGSSISRKGPLPTHLLHATSQVLGDWLEVDWDMAEFKLWQWMLYAADKTQVEWVEFNHDLYLGPRYGVGNWIGIGLLRCSRCNAKRYYRGLTEITACDRCANKLFLRIA